LIATQMRFWRESKQSGREFVMKDTGAVSFVCWMKRGEANVTERKTFAPERVYGPEGKQ